MREYVLDSYALLSYCEGEPGAREVAGFFKKALSRKIKLSLCVVNWGEMYYIALREGGVEVAEKYRFTLDQYPVKIINADLTVTLQAAHYKGSYKISYADAYAAALAKLKRATLITGDPDFSELENEIRIHWLTQ
jgi:ribonuclease VapC